MTSISIFASGAALAIGLSVATAPVAGQNVPGRTPASDSVFRRAVVLVNDGEGAAARSLLDSMVNAARPTSLEHAEALYWRATVALTAAEAERDYRALILDHPLSPRVPDALLRLAQLELARGDRESAIRRLQRLDVEHPAFAQRARTSYWMARAYLEQDDLQRGCAAVAEARARTAANDVELRNQVDFIAQRCPSSVASGQPAAAEQPTGATAAPAPAAQPPRGPPPRAEQGNVPATRTSPPPAAPERAAPPAATGRWAVQVAAFSQRAQANVLAERMRGRGYQTRVDGTTAPFRVRVGSYATRAEAVAALERLKASGQEGFVVQLESR